MKQAGTKNPVFLLDEIDKLGMSFQGDPASALLEVLDPAQNDSFTDHYMGIPYDLSEVLFICTANFLQNIPGPLLDRMEMIEFSGYTEGEKQAIARQYLIPRQLRRNGLTEEQIELTGESLARVISEYTREAGVRQLEREIGRLARKVARKVAARELEAMVVDTDNVSELLGRPKVHPEKMALRDQTGVATGMYYTPAGGDIMFVEASSMPGKGELVLTGQLGDVMKESARAAWTYARSNAAALSIDPEDFERDVHIHVPGRGHPQGRAVRRRDHGDGSGLEPLAATVAARPGDDRRDHPERSGAADRWRQGEDPGRRAGWHPQVPAAVRRTRRISRICRRKCSTPSRSLRCASWEKSWPWRCVTPASRTAGCCSVISGRKMSCRCPATSSTEASPRPASKERPSGRSFRFRPTGTPQDPHCPSDVKPRASATVTCRTAAG